MVGGLAGARVKGLGVLAGCRVNKHYIKLGGINKTKGASSEREREREREKETERVSGKMKIRP